MDCEKAYKDALERAKSAIKECGDNKERITMIESIFPELKMSEDERIRKAIHIYLDWLDGRKDYAPKGEYSIKDMIAWLEKQGNQKQQWIDKTTKWLEDQDYRGWIESETGELIYEFKQFAKEEL